MNQKPRCYTTLLLVLVALSCLGGQANVVYFEHSIRWTNESNFPYYLKLPEVRYAINSIVENRFKQKFKFEAVTIAVEPEYRRINGFGKSKITWPKSASADNHEIALISAITRGTYNMNMYWSMQVSVRQAGKIVYTKEVNHKLLPYSFSFYMNHQRWMEQKEFIQYFMVLLDEVLELQQPLPEGLPLNSKEMTQAKAIDLVPDNKIISLIVADTVMGKQRHRAYEVREDNKTIETFIYREADYLDAVYRESFSGALISELLNGIVNGTGLVRIPIPDRYEIRLNTLESSSGEKLVIRNSRGQDAPTNPANKDTSIPVFALELMNINRPDATFFSCAYFKALNTNNEQLSKQHFRPSGTYGTLGVTNTHFLRGQSAEQEIELIYPEQDGMLLMTNSGQSVGVMPMINENANSRHFFHLKLADNNKGIIPAELEAGMRSPHAQQYKLYIDKQQNPETVRRNILLLILMIHSIDWPPIDQQETISSPTGF
jgi:hypothetical protein